MKQQHKKEFEEREDIVIGRNAVMETLKSDRTIECLYIANGHKEGSINAIIKLAREKKIVIKEVDKKKLDTLCGGVVHQGVIARVTPYKYYEVEDIIQTARDKGESPFMRSSWNNNS